MRHFSREISQAGHDPVYDQDKLPSKRLLALCFLSAIIVAAILCSGCSSGKSYTREASGLGLLLEPLGSGPNAPRAALGSFAVSAMVKDKEDSQPLLNRVFIEGPLGAQHKATQGAGPVGDELAKAGSTLPAVVAAEHKENRPLLPFEAPVNLPERPKTQ
jgi:hypothetical protein